MKGVLIFMLSNYVLNEGYTKKHAVFKLAAILDELDIYDEYFEHILNRPQFTAKQALFIIIAVLERSLDKDINKLEEIIKNAKKQFI